jgi:(p)ppGpp synthase/HD superfamily hydrolase
VPGDPILAYLSSGRGIIVHREDCANVDDYRKHPEKWLSVTWAEKPERLFGSELRVEVANRMGVLAAVAAAIAGTETNIEHVALEERDAETSVLVFEVKVRDRTHLARVIRVIRRMPDVLKLSRTLAVRTRED